MYLGVKGSAGYRLFFAPFLARDIRGRVGLGDTCTAAYVHARLNGMALEDAVRFAAAATSLKLEHQGPLKARENEVISYLKEKYADIDPELKLSGRRKLYL